MADREFKIKITTTADVGGAKETASALGDVRDKTRETVPAQNEATEATDRGTLSKKEFRQALRLISKESPEASMALRGFGGSASSVGILVTAAAYAVGRLKEDIKNLNDSLSTSDWESYKGVIESLQKSLQDMQVEADTFARSLDRIGTAADGAIQKLKDLQDLEDKQSKATETVEDAKKHQELEETNNVKDPIERAQKRAEIEERYAAAKKKRLDEEGQNRLGEKRQALADEEDSQEGLSKKLEEARAKRSGLGMTEGSIDKEIETQKSRLAATQKELETKQARNDELEGMGWLRRSTPQQQEMIHLGEQIPSLERQELQLRDIIARMEKDRPGKIGQVKAADEDVKSAEDELRGSKERSAKLRHEIPLDEQKEAIAAKEREDLAGIGKRTRQSEYERDVLGSKDGQLFSDVSHAEEILQQGGKISTSQQAEVNAVKKMLDSHHENSQAILQALGQAAKNDAELARQIAMIRKKLEGSYNQ